MSEWAVWGGGKRPVAKDALVQVKIDGVLVAPNAEAGYLTWDHQGFADITAYRLVDSVQESKPSNPKDAIGIRKTPLSVVPLGVLAELGVALLEGTAKYGRHNYRGVGVRASVYFDATIRHLFSWWEGEDVDPDSSLSHITKAIASLTVLRDAMLQDKVTDDRPPRSKPFYAALNAASAALIDKHADKSPHHYTINDALDA